MVFDYFEFSPQGGGFEDGVVDETALSGFERVYFFVSHKHPDHFSREIYGLAEHNPNTAYIVAAGTPKGGDVTRIPMSKGGTYSDGYIDVYAGGSTDIGVSFVVRAEGKTLFHAGDLNCWHWTQEWSDEEELHSREVFTKELMALKPHLSRPDAAFFPVDPRMKGPYDDGAREFTAEFSPKLFIPMHCQHEYFVTERFKKEMQNEDMRVFSYDKRGALCEL